MSTKNDVVIAAYQEIRVSGLTVNPRPSDSVMALDRLENMMAEFFSGWNLGVGYNFEDQIDPNAQTNVARQHFNMMAYNLAVRLIPAFNKQVPQTLFDLASTAFSTSLGIVARENIRNIQPSRTMPRGSGNTVRFPRWNKYVNPVPLPPTSSSNNKILVGETMDYYEDFSAWLGSSDISSYEIEADPLLTIVSSSNESPRIDYRIQAQNSEPSSGPWQIVKITATDSEGRVDIRLINFEVASPPEVS